MPKIKSKKDNDTQIPTEKRERNRVRGKGKVKIVKRQHVNNEELHVELLSYIKTGIASEKLGEMFLALVDNYATKSNFSGYSFLEEMKSRAIFFLLKYSKGYKPAKSKNPFAYCTQIVHNAFVQVIKKENKLIKGKKEYIENFFRHVHYNKKDDDLMG